MCRGCVPLRGEHFDGHQFIGESLVKKAAAIIVSNTYEVQESTLLQQPIPVIRVNDTLKALGDLAHAWRKRNKARIVAITGSNGKTTTREMTATILAGTHKVLKPEHNWNNLIGLPLTLLRLEASDEIAVLEMGMNRKGEIQRLAQIAQPHIGVITNISNVHLEYLQTLENVARAKGELFESLSSQDYAVVNMDDTWIMEQAKHCPARQITYGLNPQAQIRAVDISSHNPRKIHFTLQRENDYISIVLNLPGVHSVYNALAAAAIATTLGLSMEDIKSGLEHFKDFPGRMEIMSIAGNITVINDTYNANPVSMEIALKTLVDLSGEGRSIAVLGDMLELGNSSSYFHRKIGMLLKELNLSAAFLLGPHSHEVAEEACEQGIKEEVLHIAQDHEQLAHQLDRYVRAHDCILFKGSRGMQMEKCLELFLRLRTPKTNASSLIKTAPME